MKWISIIPLIGGMSIGAKNVIGTYPEAILSYEPFYNNDKLLLDYWKYDNYIVVPDNNKLEQRFENIDLVNTVCPCAGLSMLNGGNRGADAPQNEWMYKTAELVLEQVKPKVFMGENAPALYTNSGAEVVEKLREIGQRNGYTLSLYKTCNSQHGVPQRRVRTFYFFWKDSKVPMLPFYSITSPKLVDFLNEIPDDALDHDKTKAKEELQNNFWWQFINDTVASGEELRKLVASKNRNTLSFFRLLFDRKSPDFYNNIDKAILYAEKHNPSYTKTIKHMRDKVKADKRFWDSSAVFLTGDKTNALISKNNFQNIHPTEDRFLTMREHMHLMKLPHDFRVERKRLNAITQNVIVDTAEHFTQCAVDYIKGDNLTDFEDVDFLKTDNMISNNEKLKPLF